jgi:hypothetical protein
MIIAISIIIFIIIQSAWLWVGFFNGYARGKKITEESFDFQFGLMASDAVREVLSTRRLVGNGLSITATRTKTNGRVTLTFKATQAGEAEA